MLSQMTQQFLPQSHQQTITIPVCTLNTSTVLSSGDVHTAHTDEVPLDASIDSNSQKQPIINLQHEGRCCREYLKELQNLTYLCANRNAFQTLKQPF